MIVELFGHAGSGKSTLARRLAERLETLGVAAIALDARAEIKRRRWPGDRLLQARALLGGPGLTVRGLAVLGVEAVRQPWLLGTLGGIGCRARIIEAHAADRRVVLIDEGVLHGTWSLTLMRRETRPEALEAFLDRLPAVEHAVSVRPPRERIHANLKRGGDSRLRGLDADAVSRLLDRQEALLDRLEARIARSGRLYRVEEPWEATAVEELAARLAEEWRLRYRGGEPLRYSSRLV